MAAVVDLAMRHIAPDVSLYVNAHNTSARRDYEKLGFRQTGQVQPDPVHGDSLLMVREP
jgi:predicted GNAT family acetyltransferase